MIDPGRSNLAGQCSLPWPGCWPSLGPGWVASILSWLYLMRWPGIAVICAGVFLVAGSPEPLKRRTITPDADSL